jgi:hypothetical protein
MDPAQRATLERLRELLTKIGSANDAQDHGCREDADLMRLEASAGIRELMAEHPFIGGLLPGLARSLETRNIEASGWSSLVDAVERELRPRPSRTRRQQRKPSGV